MRQNLDTQKRCVTGAPTTIDRCVGFCRNKGHVGYITVPILCRRQCIEKKCHYFTPIKNHPFWGRREQMLQKEYEKKEVIRTLRNNEKLIPGFLDSPPESFLMCKHLYDNVYIMVCKQGSNLKSCYKCNGNVVYVYEVEKQKEQNISVTYISLLPVEIREKKMKNDQKNRER